MRTYRITRAARHARLLAATGVTLAALALTACDNGLGAKDEGAARSTATATNPSDPEANTGTDANKETPNGQTDSNAQQTTNNDDDASDPAARALCNASNLTVTAQPVSRPLNHLLITVTNTGSKLCDLPYSPVVRFDEAQWAPQVIEDSQPQAVVTLAPGESGHAGVLLSSADGSGENGTTAHKLTVGFQGLEPGSNGGPSALPSLPAEGVYYDSSLAVTYWQASMDDALSY